MRVISKSLKATSFLIGAVGIVLAGCTATPSGNINFTGSTNGGNSNGTNSNGTNSNGGNGFVDPFQPGGGGTVVLNIPNSSGSILAYTAQRCYQLGDSLAKWIGGSKVNTNMGRFDWAEMWTSSILLGNKPYSDYYGIAKSIRDYGGDNTTPLYPLFTTVTNGLPDVVAAGTAEPSDPASTKHALTVGRILAGFCIASCYRGNVPLYFAPQAEVAIAHPAQAMAYPVKQARDQWLQGNVAFASVVTLAPSAVLGALSLISSAVDYFTVDTAPSTALAPQGFYKFMTAQGHSITVTHNHGLLTQGGMMRPADEIVASFRAGNEERLLTALNDEEAIVKVIDLNLPELAYNVKPRAAASPDQPFGDLRQQVVVSGDGYFLSASSLMQNNMETMASQLNRLLDYDNSPDPLQP